MDGSLVIGVLTRLRRLFYAVTPNETSFPTVEEVPKYVDEAIPFFIGLIILEIPILYLRGKRLPRFNDSFGSLANGILSLLHGLLFRSVELTTYIWVYEHWNVIDLHWDSAWTWILGFVGVDLGYYWVHRCGHEVNLMWAGHQVHHSSEDYNLVTALRQSAIHRYVGWMFYLPLALVMPPSVFLVHSQFNLLYQFWIHTEICHLRYMWTAFKETKGFQNKLAVIWKGPGWAPGKPRTGLMEDIPDIHAPQEKFDRQLPLWINLYIWTHMLLLIVFYGILAHFKTENSPYITLTGVVFIVFTLSSFGALYDHRSRASLQETVRCFVFLLIVRGFATPSAVSSSPGLSLIALYLASFAIWFFVCVRQISVKIKAKSS